MITEVINRNGIVVSFDPAELKKTFDITHDLSAKEIDKCSAIVINKLNSKYKNCIPTTDQILDTLIDVLMSEKYADVANKIIQHNKGKSDYRLRNSDIIQTIGKLTHKDAKDSNLKRENANINGDTSMGIMLRYGSEIAKTFYKLDMMKPEHSFAHDNGDIHIHDLDFYGLTTTCCQIDLTKLFTDGFNTGHGFLREPNSIQSYAALACIAIQSNQNDQHGGQSVPKFDFDMAKGVSKSFIKNMCLVLYISEAYLENDLRALEQSFINYLNTHSTIISSQAKSDFKKIFYEYDRNKYINEYYINFAWNKALELTERNTYQAMESLIHNLNTLHSRCGSQVPFSSLNYGTDTSYEGRMVIKNLLKATEAGLGNGETPIFPIQIFKVKEGINFNENDPNYDLFQLACKVSAKRLFPNFSFIDAPFNLKYYVPGKPATEIAYMGCRTRVIGNIHDKNKEIVTGRGNLSFTTINLPRLGIEYRGDTTGFYKALKSAINLVFDQLLDRYKIQASKKCKNYPFLMGQGVWINSDMLDPDDSVENVLRHGTLTLGFIGLAECLKALCGEHHGESRSAHELGLAIIKFMRNMCDNQSAQTGLNFSLIATPAESTAGRFVALDRKKYGIIPGITDREYYTNSFHIPVYFPISAFKKITLEAPFHELTNGGHITYIELDGDPTQNPEAFMTIIKFMKECGIGYGAINHPVDHDPVCGFTGIIGDKCPRCGRREGEAISPEKLREIKKHHSYKSESYYGQG